MSTMVRVGHWLVLAVLGVFAVWMLVISVPSFPNLFRSLHQVRVPLIEGRGEVGFDIPAKFIAWIPALLCAWGIWTWRRWGQILTIVFCVLGLLLELAGIISFGHIYLGIVPVSLSAAAVATVVWLLLPSVRVQFHY